MQMLDIIIKKRDGFELSKEEIEFVVNGYTDGSIPDYQMSSFLMATYFQGMTDNEATTLAIAMEKSGDEIDLSRIKGFKVDKHSTGGVGDKTSIVLAPLVASLGIEFAKMSGRGLGHTGGTLDKLESIPGYNIQISPEDFISQVEDIHIALVGQSGNLTPADKKMYALRDVTGTVDSIPLIAASIMSKKLAAGSDGICLDVKVGSGAFMKNIEDARRLATLMCNIGRLCGRKMTAVLTNMDEPLGLAVGNTLEVKEAIETLNGRGPKDLRDLCLRLGAYLVVDAGLTTSYDEAIDMLVNQINNGKALDKLAELVRYQGGNEDYVYHPELFEDAEAKIEVKSNSEGFVKRIDSYKVGRASMLLGAGREKLTDEIDHAVGIVLNKKVGDYVKVGETLGTIYTNGKNTDECIKMFSDAFTFSKEQVEVNLILDVIR